MASAPQVRDLNQLIGELGQAYIPQKTQIDQDIQAAENSGQAQEAGLGATQKQQFGQIEQKAQNKGMFFSGFSPDEQAKYTSTVYLPALANLRSTIAATRSQLLGKKANIDSQIANQAFTVREGDVAAQRAWQQQQEQMAFQAEQARLAREAAARENAANRRASAAPAAPKPTRDEYNNYVGALKSRLKAFKDSGYKSDIRSQLNYRGEEANALINQFKGVISPQEINAMVNKVYGMYYVD